MSLDGGDVLKDRMKYIRKNLLHLSQEEFGEKIGISRSNVANIEVGRINLTDRVISSICKEYNINEEWLKTGTGEIEKPMLPEDEYSKAAAGLVKQDDKIAMEILTSYFSLDEQSKTAIKNFILDIANRIEKEQDVD